MDRLTSGVPAGLGATVPMTLAMVAMHRRLPWHQQYPLPPRLITENAVEKAGADRHLDEPERTGLTFLAHFGYGAFVGGLFGLIAPRQTSHAVGAGVLYGLAVWAGSYLGLLPALRLLSPATRHPAERNALMIVAHVVWGATAGLLAGALNRGASSSAG